MESENIIGKNKIVLIANKSKTGDVLIENMISSPGLDYWFRKKTNWRLMTSPTEMYYLSIFSLILFLIIILIPDLFSRFFLGSLTFFLLLLLISYYEIIIKSNIFRTILIEKFSAFRWSENYLAFLGWIILGTNELSIYSIAKELQIKKSSANDMIKKLELKRIILSEGKISRKKYLFNGLNFEITGDINQKEKFIFKEYLAFLFKILCVHTYYLKKRNR